jgi:TatD DNase family protein
MPNAPTIDIGVNLTNKAFRDDIEETLDRAEAAGVIQMVITGTTVDASRDAAALADRLPGRLFSTVGIHPHHARDCDAEALASLKALSEQPPVVAIGECGLDYNRNYSEPAQQRLAFELQLQLAAELNLPVFLHERDAHDDFLGIVRNHRRRLRNAVVHCFTGSSTAADAYLEEDLHIGITGWICDERRGLPLREIVSRIPGNRLMLETDAPYLLPRNLPNRPKNGRNEPAFLAQVLITVAECRGESTDALAAATTDTARAFFGLPDV